MIITMTTTDQLVQLVLPDQGLLHFPSVIFCLPICVFYFFFVCAIFCQMFPIQSLVADHHVAFNHHQRHNLVWFSFFLSFSFLH